MRCRIALQGVGSPRFTVKSTKKQQKKAWFHAKSTRKLPGIWLVFFSWYEAIWLLQGKLMCFHTGYVIEKWCKTCTNPTSYTLSYTLSFTRNSFYLLPFSLCGVGNVGEFKKTFFGNGEGRASERKTVSTVFFNHRFILKVRCFRPFKGRRAWYFTQYLYIAYIGVLYKLAWGDFLPIVQ